MPFSCWPASEKTCRSVSCRILVTAVLCCSNSDGKPNAEPSFGRFSNIAKHDSRRESVAVPLPRYKTEIRLRTRLPREQVGYSGSQFSHRIRLLAASRISDSRLIGTIKDFGLEFHWFSKRVGTALIPRGQIHPSPVQTALGWTDRGRLQSFVVYSD